MPNWDAICAELGIAHAVPAPVSGGDISAAWRIGSTFLKTGPSSSLEMFKAEAEGLAEIAASGTVRVPLVLGVGESAGTAYVAMEWIEFERPRPDTEAAFGEQLAQMHRSTAKCFGWHRDNTVGLTPQCNDWSDTWLEFLREQRIAYQLRLASESGFDGELQDKGRLLLKRLPVFFDPPECVPSLLHGDLWGGNWGASDGLPVVFDPAVYFGDRETDLAMTRLFGGFGHEFYAAYEASWPLAEGHNERQAIYQLYHVLNHLNLFGSAYLGRAIGLMDELL